MAITDSGVPSVDPHTTLAQLITTNMTSPSESWTPVVNQGWLQYKLQKTYQMCITPVYADNEPINLTGGSSTAAPRIATAYFDITLYHPTRSGAWSLFRNVMAVLNDETKTSPQGLSGMTGVNGGDYHFVRVVRAEEGKTIEFKDRHGAGMNKVKDECDGYRSDITVAIRWNE